MKCQQQYYERSRVRSFKSRILHNCVNNSKYKVELWNGKCVLVCGKHVSIYRREWWLRGVLKIEELDNEE